MEKLTSKVQEVGCGQRMNYTEFNTQYKKNHLKRGNCKGWEERGHPFKLQDN